MASATIRPITKLLPTSKELWDDTNLPLCVVVTPAARTESKSKATPLSVIPKCLHCGAPHPTKQTHFRPIHHSILLCYLCGHTSSTRFEDQEDARVAEVLDVETYDHHGHVPTESDQDVSIPLFGPHTGMTLPAMACPPVWWIVLDASQAARSYWHAVGTVLEAAVKDMPPHVHVGMVAANATQISTWDLANAFPHVWHHAYASSDISLSLVPADAMHKSNIQTALRAISDCQPGTLASSEDDDSDTTGMSLGLALEVILEFMEKAQHPGVVHEDESDIRYAGGRILCLLGNRPLEIDAKLLDSQPAFLQGGVGGACSSTDKWRGGQRNTPETEPTDMTPKNLQEFVNPSEPEDMWDSLGSRCATAALGVDVLVVVPKEDEPDVDSQRLAVRPWYGLPFLRPLSHCSGAPGPLLFSTQQSVEALQQEVLARSPWQPGMVFGAELRVRMSPGFVVESTPVDPIGRDKLQLALALSSGGLSGPAVVAEPNLWIMGSSDPHTSVIVDFQVDKVVKDRYSVEGLGEVATKPVLQTCVAYTSVEKDEKGNYHTSRRIKISSVSMTLTQDVEPMYDHLDLEALATVLYQKLLLNSFQEGVVAAQTTAEMWLQSLLVCVYQSAQVEQAKIEELADMQGGLASAEFGEASKSFVASERLLDIKGDLGAVDVLMGKGHDKIAHVPLLLYALLQSDALKPTSGSFRPSMDARCAAMSQMFSMTPTTLAKCIAPSLQLWSTKQDDIILESVDLNESGVRDLVEEFQSDDTVLLLDSPQGVLVYAAKQMFSNNSQVGKVGLGPKLNAAVEAATQAYRTKPSVRYELGRQASKAEQDIAKMMLDKFLLEDKQTFSGKQDFKQWKRDLSTTVKEELEKSGDV